MKAVRPSLKHIAIASVALYRRVRAATPFVARHASRTGKIQTVVICDVLAAVLIFLIAVECFHSMLE